MTQPPAPETPPSPSIWTRLDGQPLQHPVPQSGRAPMPGGSGEHLIPPSSGQQFVLATWWSRALAFFIDGLLFGTAAFVLALAVGVGLGLTVSEAAAYFSRVEPLPESVADPTPFRIALVAQGLLPGIALAIALVRMQGQTPGKRAMKIRVVRADGRPMDAQTAFRRELAAKTILLTLVAVLTAFVGFVLNYLWPLWDREHRTGHDALVRTRVVQEPRK